ncbi:hypothetical protein C8F04DRAFT_1267868 [Mycena alexandri]|uniref:Uncharacterized protein n=1 Tax=Mycena alexandri TaxID=1745969 RepID=A0AAD6WVD9_9AGAR|nr:hypothetical protein C8F04DRAFT_1267868 [Mycena alexandri]
MDVQTKQHVTRTLVRLPSLHVHLLVSFTPRQSVLRPPSFICPPFSSHTKAVPSSIAVLLHFTAKACATDALADPPSLTDSLQAPVFHRIVSCRTSFAVAFFPSTLKTHHAQWPSRKILRIPKETALQRQAWRPERTRSIDRFYRLQPLQPRRALNCVKAVADPNTPPIVSPSTAFNRVKPVALTLNPDSFYRPSIASTLSRLITNPRVAKSPRPDPQAEQVPGMGKKSSEAQRAATARYRERNKVELKRKARERMAKRRTELKKSEEAWAAYSAKAREDAARYRAVNAKSLAVDQAARRAKRSIEKRGFTAWHQDYLKRNPRQPHVMEEDLPEWPESSSDSSDS